jgi:serralysin
MKQMYSIFKILTLSILITLSFSQVAISGDYNDDGMSDIAFYNPGSTWATVPILFSHNGDGTWNAANDWVWNATTHAVPRWVNDPGVIAVPGDYNHDGMSDIAFYNPGSGWATVPILFSNGDGTWNATNRSAPTYVHSPGVIAVPGDYNDDGMSDIAFFKPGSNFETVPIFFSNGDGTWNATNSPATTWANSHCVIAVPGDYNGDGMSDIAFYNTGYPWATVPILFSNGDGTWNTTTSCGSAPTWWTYDGLGFIAVPGDYNDDGMSDIAFYNPGSNFETVPIFFSNGDGTWNATNSPATTWAHAPGAIAIAVPGSYGLCCIVPPPDDEHLPPFWDGGGGPMR